MESVSVRRLRQNIEALGDFRDAYTKYLNATVLAGQHPSSEPVLRREAARTSAGAARAMSLAGTNVGWDLRHSGGPLIKGLASVAFLHETPHGYSDSIFTPGLPPYQGVLDIVEQTLNYLEHAEREARRRRWNPLFWIDRALRALLGIPAYLLGLLLGRPANEINASPFGLPLRLLALAVEVVGVAIAGRQVGWW
ncbi:MAG: hypothetical protein WKF65_08695 [Gaiellaceae bacterium]